MLTFYLSSKSAIEKVKWHDGTLARNLRIADGNPKEKLRKS